MSAEAAGETPLRRAGDPPVGLYIHVPFCRSLCSYCAFAKEEYRAERAAAWLDGLEREMDARAGRVWDARPRVDTLFLGGGTPSTLPPGLWDRLARLLRTRFALEPDLEFTAEVNPESFTPEQAAVIREAGVNRVSLGAQTFDPVQLAALRRAHDADAPPRAVAAARDAGFAAVSLDLMYGLPGQDAASFAASLRRALELDPDHLSAYCLGLEPGTPLAAEVAGGRTKPADDETARAQHDLLVAAAESSGLNPYEISNFARTGRECRHNLRYWRRQDFLALGPSAHGLLAGRRWANPATLDAWLTAYREGLGPRPKPVPVEEARFEWVFLRLRLSEGLDRREYETVWEESWGARYGAVTERLVRHGLLRESGSRLQLPRDAWFVSDGVFAEFAP